MWSRQQSIQFRILVSLRRALNVAPRSVIERDLVALSGPAPPIAPQCLMSTCSRPRTGHPLLHCQHQPAPPGWPRVASSLVGQVHEQNL